MATSSWGWHIIDNDADPTDLTRLSHAVGIKLVGGANVYKRAQELSTHYPGKPIVLRLIHLEGSARPATPQAAVDLLDSFCNTYGLRHCWFQTFQNMPEMNAATAAWDSEMVRLARPKGIKLIVGDFSMGKSGVTGVWPGEDLWPSYYPVFREMVVSGPSLVKLGYQLYIGNGDLSMGEGWLSLPLRYRSVRQVHLIPNGWGSIEWCGTEAGFDAGNMEQEGVSPEQAADTMIALDQEWAKDPQMWIGFAYTLDKSTWAQNGFNMRGTIFERVSSYQQTGPAPVPEPTPPPSGSTGRFRLRSVWTGLNIRKGPGTTFPIFGEMTTHDPFKGTRQGDWVVLDPVNSLHLAFTHAGKTYLEEV